MFLQLFDVGQQLKATARRFKEVREEAGHVWAGVGGSKPSKMKEDEKKNSPTEPKQEIS